MRLQGKIYWLVGASDGIGAALALQLSAAGAVLILSARNEAALQSVAARLTGPSRVLPLDLRDATAIEAAVKTAGRIDGLIYCAGAYKPMRADDWDVTAATEMIDVNFLAAARFLGAAMPGFVAQDQGHIVLIGSLAGFMGLPGSIGYAASKAGLMQLGEAMQMDLRGRPIQVQIINPGFVKTRLTDKNDFAMPFLMSPEDAARRVMKAMRSGRLVTSFPLVFSLVFRLGRLLPPRLRVAIFAARDATRD